MIALRWGKFLQKPSAPFWLWTAWIKFTRLLLLASQRVNISLQKAIDSETRHSTDRITYLTTCLKHNILAKELEYQASALHTLLPNAEA
ncbi:predicted protein [Sclerotinia sclerotiorum 1980 UF-70]|uniref:Uncharacterized protein n=1 Tax=Sclerotinia sclerotiorum (strain ATCC 18683 / 1980 / Ss-1) TaxID=665079 RepID=A7F5Z2_SCLS1|nr:predicted protein [Sclerotinia sclerotiorum 1980 UF-70]EDN98163.1 predicted protein [Sclerotinia sclerotiorum 1980 UF-70]